MKDAGVFKVSDVDGPTYLVECPHCHHSAFRTAAYVVSKAVQRCPSCHALMGVTMPEPKEEAE